MAKKKSQAELAIEALADVFNIAGEGFEKFYKESKDKGDSSTAASSGNSSKAASSGYSSKAASSGYSSTAASSGNSSKAECSGKHSACASVGYRGAVRGDLGNGIAAFEYNDKNELLSAKADIIDGKKLKPQQWYIVEGGGWQAVDFTDGIFTRVISVRNGVKKVKNDNGKILFIVSDDNGNHAHGESIAEARDSLVYKNVAKFDGKIPKSATGAEWVGIYRAVTGACAAGVKMFVEESGRGLDEKYTAGQILKLTQGKFGHEQFKKAVG